MMRLRGMGRVWFPVVFYDGETEISIGDIVIDPSTTDFKSFQSTLANNIGISSHQFTVYLAHRNKPAPRFPITAKSNFSAISGHSNDSLFLVVLKKRSNSNPKRDPKRTNFHIINNNTPHTYSHPPPKNLTLLSRNPNHTYDEVFAGLVNMGFDGLSLGSSDDETQRVNNGTYGYGGGGGGGVICEECLRAKEMGINVGFHWCVYDTVTFGFRSPAGPIARPTTKPSSH